MLKKILIILLNKQEKIWLKQLDSIIFDLEYAHIDKNQRKEILTAIESMLRNLVKFRESLNFKQTFYFNK